MEVEEDDGMRKGTTTTTTTTGLDIAPIGDSTKTQSTIHRGSRMQPVCGATSARNNAAITAPIPSLATPQSYRAQPTCVSLFSSPCASAVRRVAYSIPSGLRCVFMHLYTRPSRKRVYSGEQEIAPNTVMICKEVRRSNAGAARIPVEEERAPNAPPFLSSVVVPPWGGSFNSADYRCGR